MQPHVLSEIVDGRIWASERPVWFSGVRLRARTSVIRLDDGRLLVHSPAPPSNELLKQMAELGEVSWLVVPNCFHHLGTPAAAVAFPEAKILGPKSAAARNAELRIDVDMREPTFGEAVPEFALFGFRSWTRPCFTTGPRKHCLVRMWSCAPTRTTTGPGASPHASRVASSECACRPMSGRTLQTRRPRHDPCKPSRPCRSRGSSSLTVKSSRKRRWHNWSRPGAWPGSDSSCPELGRFSRGAESLTRGRGSTFVVPASFIPRMRSLGTAPRNQYEYPSPAHNVRPSIMYRTNTQPGRWWSATARRSPPRPKRRQRKGAGR